MADKILPETISKITKFKYQYVDDLVRRPLTELEMSLHNPPEVIIESASGKVGDYIQYRTDIKKAYIFSNKPIDGLALVGSDKETEKSIVKVTDIEKWPITAKGVAP